MPAQQYKRLPTDLDVSVVSVEHALTQNEPYKELHVHPSDADAGAKAVTEINARFWPGTTIEGSLRLVLDKTLAKGEWYVGQFVGSRRP